MNFLTSKKIIENHFSGQMEISPLKRSSRNTSGYSVFMDSTEKNTSSSNSSSNNSSSFNIPSLEELKKKYLEKESYSDSTSKASEATSDTSEKSASSNNDDDEFDVKLIKPKEVNEADNTNEERTVIISKNKGIIGSQG